MARVNYSEPPGAYEIMESISVRADGGLHPPTPCRRCHVGRVERGTEGFDLHSPNTVLSPFWCSPQRGRSPSTRRVAGANEVSPLGVSFRLHVDLGLQRRILRRRYQVGRVYRYIPIQPLSPFWDSPQLQGQAKCGALGVSFNTLSMRELSCFRGRTMNFLNTTEKRIRLGRLIGNPVKINIRPAVPCSLVFNFSLRRAHVTRVPRSPHPPGQYRHQRGD